MSVSQPKTLLFVHSSDELYGADVVLLQLLMSLDRQRFEPIVALPSDISYQGRLSAALERADIEHHTIKMGVLRRRYFNPTGLIPYLAYLAYGTVQLKRLVDRHEVDLIHSNTSAVLGGALAARLAGLPHVWHVHEILEQPAWLGKLIYRFISANSTEVIAISHAVARRIREQNVDSSVKVIWDGIDCVKFGPHVDGAGFRGQWCIGPHEVLVGMVGRISHWKGQELFLGAASEVAQACPQARFAIVGDPVPGSEGRLTDLRTQAESLGLEGKVIFQSFTERVPQVMRALDVLVLPSTLPEPLGLVVLEAMASERPVIAAGHGGAVETVADNETGLLFEPGDEEALTSAMAALVANPERRKRMGRQARQRVLEHFSLERFNERIAQVYEDLGL